MAAPLVGRGAEMDQLEAALHSIGEGQGQVLFILGEAGIGKSRLIEEARQQLTAGDVRWLEGRALSYGGALSYWPIIQLLQNDVISFKMIGRDDLKFKHMPSSVLNFVAQGHLPFDLMRTIHRTICNFEGSVWEEKIKERGWRFTRSLKA